MIALRLYTDGSCPKPGTAGGWAWIAVRGDADTRASGPIAAPSTHQVAEVTAAIEGRLFATDQLQDRGIVNTEGERLDRCLPFTPREETDRRLLRLGSEVDAKRAHSLGHTTDANRSSSRMTGHAPAAMLWATSALPRDAA